MSTKAQRASWRKGRAKMDHEKLYRLSALADAADLNLRTIQKHVAKGLVKVVRVGPYGVPRVKESEFQRYLGENKDRQ